MTQPNPVILNGNDLTVEDIVAIGVGDRKVALDPAALERCRASRSFLEEEVAAKRVIYGVNTSFGPMCNKIIQDSEIEALQVNLIRSHAAGLGDPLKPYVSLAIAAVRLNTLAKGYSGVRTALLEYIRDLINLAHLSLTIIGEGRSWYEGEMHDTAELYRSLGIKPFRLGFKEGIALMNGTSAMTALAAYALYGAKKLLRIGCVTGAFALEIFGGIDDAFDDDLHLVKPHPGQIRIAEAIRSLYAGSGNITLRRDVHDLIRRQENGDGPVFETSVNVQDVYSIRCTPQVLAPVAEAIEYATRVVETEANSSNDNPIIIPAKKMVIHGGNFHGQSIGFAMDVLCMAVATLCNLSERRIDKYLDRNLNEGLPEFLIPGTAGLTMGFMGAQYLATSSTAENRQLANPASTHSISCNASNQDVVSMGTVAARKAFKAVSNAKHIVTLEVLADLQALSFRHA